MLMMEIFDYVMSDNLQFYRYKFFLLQDGNVNLNHRINPTLKSRYLSYYLYGIVRKVNTF